MEIEHTFGKRSKKPVDDNAPNRVLSAYFLFANKMRPQVMKKHEGASMAIVGKEIARLWKKASSSDKAPFEKKATADKKTYASKMEKYQKTSNYKKHQMRMLAWKIHETKKPFRKDENAPKRSLSAYMLYAGSVRKQIVKENPDIAVSEVMGEQSVMWKALGNSERQKWVDKAAAEKKKYDTKLARYMKTADYQKYVEERDAYKGEMKEKRNKLMGVKKRARTPTKVQKSPSKKKAKRSPRRSRTPKSSKSRSVSRRRRSAKSPKSPKRRSRQRRSEKRKASKRRSRTPKASKSRSKSRRSSTSRSRSAKRRSASRSKSRRRRSSRRSKKASE